MQDIKCHYIRRHSHRVELKFTINSFRIIWMRAKDDGKDIKTLQTEWMEVKSSLEEWLADQVNIFLPKRPLIAEDL